MYSNPGTEGTPPFRSPFMHILNTNYMPDKDDIQKITVLLREPKLKLDSLNRQILRLEGALTALRTERDSLQAHIDNHCTLLSPFRCFPEDLLREIFVRCLDPYPIRSTKHAPLLFTRICRYWREVALKTPRLWSSIHIFIPKPTSFDWGSEIRSFEKYRGLVSERLSGAERWLKRSGSVSITFSLSV
ncbi:hypothetical protein L218DRAFT_879103, partial [Marasmius fiardii PR-910]